MKNDKDLKDNYYNEIKGKLLEDIAYSAVKNISKERHRVETYYEIGKTLVLVDKQYGKAIIKEYSKKLTAELGKKYTPSLLYKIIQFYNIFEKVPTLSGNLSWSIWYEMLSIKDINKIIYYVYQCEQHNLSVRELRDRIKSKEYERLDDETKLKLINKKDTTITDLIPNPIIIKNVNNANVEYLKEKVLQQMIMEDIPSFLKSLGNGYTFVENEYKIKIGDTFNSIDLLLFNIEYNSYIVIELKVTELKKEHIGQIHVYMNYIDSNVKKINQNKTIGIILVRKNNQFIMEYCSDKRIISREYKLV
ncbi:MAG: DUF1016 family protein [Bacilli bacterium]|nr:DUF1016 family protein [Bacilli bacterium]